MRINWKVRLKSKAFWLGIVPLILILIKEVLELFGVTIEVEGLTEELTGIIETVFLILGLLGVTADPTTKGFGDSEQALTYEHPR